MQTASPTINILHQSGTFLTTDEPILKYYYHPKSTIYIKAHFWWVSHDFYMLQIIILHLIFLPTILSSWIEMSSRLDLAHWPYTLAAWVAAVVQVWFLGWELPQAIGEINKEKEKKKRKKNQPIDKTCFRDSGKGEGKRN